jgi:hypothetical protein
MLDLEFSLFFVNNVGRSHCGIVITCAPPAPAFISLVQSQDSIRGMRTKKNTVNYLSHRHKQHSTILCRETFVLLCISSCTN